MKFFLLPIAAFAVCLVLAGCRQTYYSEETASETTGGKTAVVRIALDSSRTLMPAAPGLGNVSRYTLTLTKPGSATVTYDADSPGAVAEITGPGRSFTLAAGEWNITVDAWQMIGAQEYRAASGSAAFTADEGLRTVKVTLRPIEIAAAAGAKGVFSWDFTLPEGVEASADLGADRLEGNSGAFELTPGVYDLSIALTKTSTGQTSGIYEAVYIYPGLETTANYDFSAGDGAFAFAGKIPVAGTLTFTRQGPAIEAVSYIAQAYSDAACTAAIAGASAALAPTNALSGSAPFCLGINTAQYEGLSSKTVYVRAEITAESAPEHVEVSPAEPAAVPDLGLQGKDGVSVSIGIAATCTFDYNGVQVNGNASVTAAVTGAGAIPWPVGAAEGKVFLGWYDAAEGGTPMTTAGILSVSRRVLYAHWFDTAADDPAGLWEYDSATGGMTNTYSYTAAAVSWTPPSLDGCRPYLFEAWGADGGLGRTGAETYSAGGKGGYARGTRLLSAGEITLYFYVGQKDDAPAKKYIWGGGAQYNDAPATWNGGGPGGGWRGAYSRYCPPGGAGGGASSISLVNDAWNNADVLARRILVAGGGGGGDAQTGRNGGGLQGGSGGTATGGAQTAGGVGYAGGTLDDSGVWGIGGKGGLYNNPDGPCGGGGGGGYYGGGGAVGLSGTGGGGGSSYVFGIPGIGDPAYQDQLLQFYSQYQFSEAATYASGYPEFVPNPFDLDANADNNGGGCIRVSYIPPAAP